MLAKLILMCIVIKFIFFLWRQALLAALLQWNIITLWLFAQRGKLKTFVRCVVCSISRTQVTWSSVTRMVRMGKVSIITHKKLLLLFVTLTTKISQGVWYSLTMSMLHYVNYYHTSYHTSETVAPRKFINRVAYQKQCIVLLWSVYKPQSGLGEDQQSHYNCRMSSAWTLPMFNIFKDCLNTGSVIFSMSVWHNI